MLYRRVLVAAPWISTIVPDSVVEYSTWLRDFLLGSIWLYTMSQLLALRGTERVVTFLRNQTRQPITKNQREKYTESQQCLCGKVLYGENLRKPLR